jgi:predicted DNA-binding protein (MmcQ/YjbR family)
MNVDWLREICLAFPGATEQMQWTNMLLFKVSGKMFAMTSLEPAPVCLFFKASPESFAELTERPNIIPAPYLARARWVALETRDALPPRRTCAPASRFLRHGFRKTSQESPRSGHQRKPCGPQASGKKISEKETPA